MRLIRVITFLFNWAHFYNSDVYKWKMLKFSTFRQRGNSFSFFLIKIKLPQAGGLKAIIPIKRNISWDSPGFARTSQRMFFGALEAKQKCKICKFTLCSADSRVLWKDYSVLSFTSKFTLAIILLPFWSGSSRGGKISISPFEFARCFLAFGPKNPRFSTAAATQGPRVRAFDDSSFVVRTTCGGHKRSFSFSLSLSLTHFKC